MNNEARSSEPRILTEENERWVVDVIKAEAMKAGALDNPESWKLGTKKVRTLAARLLASTSRDGFDAFALYQEYKKNKGA